MTAPPRTSVIMPAYDAGATIRASVESVLAQTVEDLELIVVDDGSPEPMQGFLEGIYDPRLRIIRHDRNRNAPSARNTALKAACAPLVSQLDADDLWEPDYLEKVLPRFEDPAVGLVYTNAHIIGHPTGHDTYIVDPSVHPMDTFPKITEQNPVPALTVTMRKGAVESVGGYARWLWVCDDYHLVLKLARAGWRFDYVHEKLASYRWPTAERGHSFDRSRAERNELRLFVAFALRHPLTPGSWSQVRIRSRRVLDHALHTPRVNQLRRQLRGAPRRAWLTLRWLGPRELVRRVVLFPTRLRPREIDPHQHPMEAEAENAREWFRLHGRRVCIVIPTYGDPKLVTDAVRSIQTHTPHHRARIVVVDDGSDAPSVRKLRRLRGIELVEGGEQRGFAANCNRGIALVGEDEDLVLLNSDVIAHEGWLESLQYTAYQATLGITGPKLLYADGTIQSAGSVRNAGAPEWFDHRYRFKPEDHPPANSLGLCLAVTGAAMYVRQDCLADIGPLDEAYGMAFEDVDWCLKAWDRGWRVGYCPFSTLTHLESKTRGTEQGERELRSQQLFWERWGSWLDDRDVWADDGGLRIVYVTEGTGPGGGHRVVFQHLEALRDAGHHPELWSLEGPPGWYDLADIPVRSFDTYRDLEVALESLDAIKVATWWNTAEFVWPAAVRRGIPAYFVQDIETSYYAHEPGIHGRVLDSYRLEFRVLTTSTWNRDRLREMHIDPAIVPPGLDDARFDRPPGVERRHDVVLALGRTEPLKNFPLTRAAWEALPEPRPELWLFGVEPELADAPGIRYFERPSDVQVGELLATATVFVQTSRHEGFCLPILEAMAAGVPVVCTDADGNRDFCQDGVNCLMPEPRQSAVADAIGRLLSDDALRRRLVAAGLETAERHRWSHRVSELDAFFRSIAPSRPRTEA